MCGDIGKIKQRERGREEQRGGEEHISPNKVGMKLKCKPNANSGQMKFLLNSRVVVMISV